jgi:hypothetical protein
MTDPNGWPDASKPGVPLNPERDGAHMLRHKETGETSPALWLGGAIVAIWLNGDGEISPYHAASIYDYLGPCHTPAEVAALIEAARREEREACAKVAEGNKGRYRTWPWWINRDGSEGTRNDSDIVEHADIGHDAVFAAHASQIAYAIRARGDA